MIKTPKALFHPDGALFVVWHKDNTCYCPVISDDDYPTPAKGLDLDHGSVTDVETLVWRQIRMTAERQIIESEGVLYPYDSDTGDEV